jgi:hypothetical protein
MANEEQKIQMERQRLRDLQEEKKIKEFAKQKDGMDQL